MFSRKFDTVTGLSLPNNLTSKSPFEVLKLTILLLWIQLKLSFWQKKVESILFLKLQPGTKNKIWIKNNALNGNTFFILDPPN